MKRSIYVFLFFILSSLSVVSQKLQIDSPIYLTARLIDETDTEAMAKLCKAYNFTEQPEEEGYIVFTSSTGDKIRFRIGDQSTYVEVTTKDKSSSVDKNLTQVGFKKSKNTYERGSKFNPWKTICTISSSPTKVYFVKSHNKQ
ncbi:MAG: hypothetical protein HDR88_02165 [Bacteroides sp.]|nr:hypothetical protein [Bacteroides sp.]